MPDAHVRHALQGCNRAALFILTAYYLVPMFVFCLDSGTDSTAQGNYIWLDRHCKALIVEGG